VEREFNDRFDIEENRLNCTPRLCFLSALMEFSLARSLGGALVRDQGHLFDTTLPAIISLLLILLLEKGQNN
jgi:hypothetical protein